MSDRGGYEWVRPPWWRRWLLRLLVVVAFAAVIVAGVTIYNEATDETESGPSLTAPLQTLADTSNELSDALEALGPRTDGRAARGRAAAALAAQREAVAALKRAPSAPAATEDALNAMFDWLDAVHTVLRRPRSSLVAKLGDRGEAAIDAFDKLDDDPGVADSVHGVAKLTAWARGRR